MRRSVPATLLAAALLAAIPPAPAQALPVGPCNTGFTFPPLGLLTPAQYEARYTLCRGRVVVDTPMTVQKVYSRKGCSKAHPCTVTVRVTYRRDYPGGPLRLRAQKRAYT